MSSSFTPADAVACRLRQAGRAVRYHRRRSAPASASPSRGPGNGILWAETGGRFQPQNAGERPEFGSQTTLRLTNPPELRGFLSTRKPPRFVGTAWWSQTESNRWPSDAAARPIRIGGGIDPDIDGKPYCFRGSRFAAASQSSALRSEKLANSRRKDWRSLGRRACVTTCAAERLAQRILRPRRDRAIRGSLR